MARASWIGSKTTARETVPPPRFTAPEGPSFPTLVRARGIAPANAFVDGMNEEECLLRCVVFLDVDSPIEFDAKRTDGTSYSVRGRIKSRVSVPPRFEYFVELERAIPVNPEPLPHDGTRRRLRLEVEFPVQYRTAREGFRAARAANVSTGGLLMTCRAELVERTMLELHFVLPSNVLNVYGFRSRASSKLRRPFRDLVVSARVAHHRQLGEALYAYGVTFVNMDRHTREEIARFVEAVRHVKVRPKS